MARREVVGRKHPLDDRSVFCRFAVVVATVVHSEIGWERHEQRPQHESNSRHVLVVHQHLSIGLQLVLVHKAHHRDVVLRPVSRRNDRMLVVDDLFQRADGQRGPADLLDLFQLLGVLLGLRLERLLVLDELLLEE